MVPCCDAGNAIFFCGVDVYIQPLMHRHHALQENLAHKKTLPSYHSAVGTIPRV